MTRFSVKSPPPGGLLGGGPAIFPFRHLEGGVGMRSWSGTDENWSESTIKSSELDCRRAPPGAEREGRRSSFGPPDEARGWRFPSGWTPCERIRSNNIKTGGRLPGGRPPPGGGQNQPGEGLRRRREIFRGDAGKDLEATACALSSRAGRPRPTSWSRPSPC